MLYPILTKQIMANSDREMFFDEIFDHSTYSRCGVVDGNDTEPRTSCDCMQHEPQTSDSIRSGNYVTCILKRKKTPKDYEFDGYIWVVEYIACYDCPVASLFERTDKSSPVAVVEGELLRGEDCLQLDPRYIWDLHVPEETIDV